MKSAATNASRAPPYEISPCCSLFYWENVLTESLRVYADTSIFGGPFDPEFSQASMEFFRQARLSRFQLVVSALVGAEIEPAPSRVKNLFQEMLALAEVTEPTHEALQLRQANLDAGILTPRSADDAFHVALATVARCSIIVSWNFQHIVHFRKIPQYNAVNSLKGFPAIAIYSPQEVIDYEEDV